MNDFRNDIRNENGNDGQSRPPNGPSVSSRRPLASPLPATLRAGSGAGVSRRLAARPAPGAVLFAPTFALLFALTLAPVFAPACGDAGPSDDPGETPAPPAAVPAPEFTLGSEDTHNRWSRTIPPTLRVPAGSVVEIHTKEASDGQITPETTAADLADLDFGRIHALTGPIFVEGAEPGDLLAVTIHEVEVAGWGWATILPGFGFLADEFTEPWIRGFDMAPGATEAAFSEGVTLPLAPFAGVMGVAPDTEEMLVTIPPRENGGNMDNRYLRPGTTVYFPVQVEGALFSVGDSHAAQGDGEVSGTAIEAPMRLVLEFAVRENPRGITEPQYENEEYYGVTGFATTIDEAARKATRFMIAYLVAERGLTREEAYVLASLAGDLKISETVDVPHMLVSMHLPKSIFREP